MTKGFYIDKLKTKIYVLVEQKLYNFFEELLDYIRSYSESKVLNGFNGKFFDLTLVSGSNTVIHNLRFVPYDIIVTRVVGATLTWNYSSFTSTTLSVTASANCTVRCFVGKYLED